MLNRKLKFTVLSRWCMICRKFLGLKNGKGVSGLSHGLCFDCRKHYLAENMIRKIKKARKVNIENVMIIRDFNLKNSGVLCQASSK